MINARFSSEMRGIIRKIINEQFVGYKVKEIDERGTITDGIIHIFTENLSLIISNEEKKIPWFDSQSLSSEEQICVFQCVNGDKKQRQDIMVVNEKIKKIEIITDYIKIPTKKYEIALDMALIIKTDMHEYMISRGWYFEECLTISKDKDLEDVYSIKQVQEEWNNFGEWEVFVERRIEEL
ncbi:MAG: hypothetical protein IJW43_06100 [Clostridia bacterium]|nr:hypothetical protein [Clostridia bacterium]